jgi:glycosyltransferase involved in cell wall biosynthesis
MKVYIPHTFDDYLKLSGKRLFCHRLGQSLLSKGVNVVNDDSVDICLDIVSFSNRKAKKHIIRIDGLCHDIKLNWKCKNKKIEASRRKASGIIFQSFHSLKLFTSFIGEFNKPFKIIHNGTDPSFYNDKKPFHTDKNIFLTFARWRPHKRLKEIMECFIKADIPNSQLIVAGDDSKSGVVNLSSFYDHPKIKYVGVLNQNELASYIKAAIATIHLCWFDACPNGVVESLIAGTPVITNNVGGTHELIELTKGGYIARIDKEYNYKPCDLYNPPKFDTEKVVEKLWKCFETRPKPKTDSLLIDNIADSYLEFFEEILK